MSLDDRLKVDYEATVHYFLHLSEVRFKLLALLPALTGLAVALLPHNLDSLSTFVVALLGLLVTTGLTIYDQRNTQIYDRLVLRAKLLEGVLQGEEPVLPGGAFRDRPPRRFTVKVQQMRPAILWHDLALAIVYAACLAVWASLSQNAWSKLAGNTAAAPLRTGGLVFVLTWLGLVALALRNDYECGKDKRHLRPAA